MRPEHSETKTKTETRECETETETETERFSARHITWTSTSHPYHHNDHLYS